MNTLVASTLGSFLFRRAPAPQWPAASRAAQAPQAAAPGPWAAETCPVVFRSEAFAEDLEDEWQA